MDISNKTLAMFLVAAIVVSIAGTTISLNKLDSIRTGPTGMATQDTGNVTLGVGSELSITLDNDIIQFGNCTTPETGVENISSWLAGGNQSSTSGALCEGVGDYNLPASIDIRNNGNVLANVSMNASENSDTFLQTPANSSSLWYNVSNSSGSGYDGGCWGSIQNISTKITSSNQQDLLLCDNLTNKAGDQNSIAIGVTIGLPVDADTGDFVEFDIWATEAGI